MDDLTASASILVDAPASVIFAILADPRQHARIDGSGTVHDIVDGPERLSEGAQFSVQMKRGLGYRTTNTVVEFETDRLIAWKHRGAHVWRYELEPDEGKVRVTETWDGSAYSGLPRLIFKATGLKGTQRAIEESLVNLREVAESDAALRD